MGGNSSKPTVVCTSSSTTSSTATASTSPSAPKAQSSVPVPITDSYPRNIYESESYADALIQRRSLSLTRTVRLRQEADIAFEFSVQEAESMINIDPPSILNGKCLFLFRVDDEKLPYHGIIIKGYILLEDKFPEKKPEIFFTPPIYHVNVNGTTGKLCNQNTWDNQTTLVEMLLLAKDSLYSPCWSSRDAYTLLKDWMVEKQPKAGWFDFVKSMNYKFDKI